jgi:predicted HTH transcriptional regulator
MPTHLEHWTLHAIQELASSGIAENDIFDFKGGLQDPEGERKTVASFANTRGGFVIFGVRDDRVVSGVDNVELPRDFGGKLRDGLTPSVDYRFGPALKTADGRHVFVVEVPMSRRGPHAVLLKGAWAFVKRTAGGNNEPMSYEEIRAAFVNSEQRRARLALLRAEVKRLTEQAERRNRDAHRTGGQDLMASRYEASTLDVMLSSVADLLATDAQLVELINEIREAAHESDRGSEIAVGFLGTSRWQHDDQARRVADFARRVKQGGERALSRLDKLLA